MSRYLQMTVAVLVVAVLGLAACSNDEGSSQVENNAEEAADEVEGTDGTQEFPTGLFEHEDGSGLSFQFNDDGTFAVSGPIQLTGTYSIDGDQYTEETNDNADCKKLAPSPPYTWAYVGDRLTFELDGVDHCGGRRSAMHEATYVRAAGG